VPAPVTLFGVALFGYLRSRHLHVVEDDDVLIRDCLLRRQHLLRCRHSGDRQTHDDRERRVPKHVVAPSRLLDGEKRESHGQVQRRKRRWSSWLSSPS
jgi:hypothetical protein